MRFLLVLILTMFFVLSVFAQNEAIVNSKVLINSFFNADGTPNKLLNDFIQEINSTTIPENLKAVTGIFANEKVNIIIDLGNDSKQVIGVLLKDTKIIEVKKDGFSDQTLNVEVSAETVINIYNSNDPINAAINALNNGKIKYYGVGFVPSVKFFFVGVINGIMNFFGSLFG